MTTRCKCHGLSGSCTLKTCFRKMPSFANIGKVLREKFDGAAKVIGSNDGLYLLPDGETIKPPSAEDLIYAEKSPNFCKPNRRYGSYGTSDRTCNPKSLSVDGCDILCCGRGYRKYQVAVIENCNCRFKWCCEVKCETCEVKKITHKCV